MTVSDFHVTKQRSQWLSIVVPFVHKAHWCYRDAISHTFRANWMIKLSCSAERSLKSMPALLFNCESSWSWLACLLRRESSTPALGRNVALDSTELVCHNQQGFATHVQQINWLRILSRSWYTTYGYKNIMRSAWNNHEKVQKARSYKHGLHSHTEWNRQFSTAMLRH